MYIGSRIREVVKERNVSVPLLADALCCTRENVHKLFLKGHLDTDLLLKISEALQYDFFAEYSRCIQFGDSSHNGYNFQQNFSSKDTAKEKLRGWYKEVADSKIPELIAAKKELKAKEDEVLNYFVNHATNAAAESLNSKMKGFRSELRGVRDLPFYLYRCSMIFG